MSEETKLHLGLIVEAVCVVVLYLIAALVVVQPLVATHG